MVLGGSFKSPLLWKLSGIKMEKEKSPYNDNFYEQHIAGMFSSAETILGLLYAHYQPKSVVDIGCGQGAWLAVARRMGADVLKGLDGAWVDRERLYETAIDFDAVDFDAGIPKAMGKYDLCISLEVAEHIAQARERDFIKLLCNLSDTVLFSAAVRQQGGTHHVNEQWQSHWIDIFQEYGFTCIDLFRADIWNDQSVEWWYRQNIFLFVGPGNNSLDVQRLKKLEKPIVNIIHPINYENKICDAKQTIDRPNLKFIISCIRKYIANKLRVGLNP